MSELDAFSRKESATIKAFLTAQVDVFRPPYGKSVKSVPRRCVFAGTTNQDAFLRDETGGRRFWPVRVGDIDIEGFMENRDQIVAEAVHRFSDRESWWLEKSQISLAEIEQEAVRAEDTWETDVKTWLYDSTNYTHYGMNVDAENDKWTTVREVLRDALGITESEKQTLQAQMRVGKILLSVKWSRRRHRHDGSRYYPPDDWDEQVSQARGHVSSKNSPSEPPEPEQQAFGGYSYDPDRDY
jgi:putative DNA primase/helicase